MRSALLFVIGLMGFTAQAAPFVQGVALPSLALEDYFETPPSFDPAIPTPASVLGFEVGAWHARHDQLVTYLTALDRASERVSLEVTGTTYEGRPLLLLTFTSPDNQRNLEQLRQQHVALSDPSSTQAVTAATPLVTWLGYGVHGNESSGPNAALLVAYYLAAAQGPGVERLLSETIILFDPSLNPDGMARFAHWANMHRSTNVLVADSEHREHVEPWPSGRTNHYWFDLNRDYLMLEHPESRARVAQHHSWKPNIVTDHHEQGTDNTFFFMPGVPSRTNPLTPPRNQQLTAQIGSFHAAALDAQDELYVTKEGFDDYYYGKGSTYPDINGAIGILFEQASSRGHAQQSINGVLRFADTIKNQVTVSLSTLRAGLELRPELLSYQRQFYRQSLAAARRDALQGYVFTLPRDPVRVQRYLELLRQHQLEVYALGQDLQLDGRTYRANEAYFVPTEQPQYRLVKALFETRKTFRDETFYDVSTWTLPLAYGLSYDEVRGQADLTALRGDEVLATTFPRAAAPAPDAYAYAFKWDHLYAPRALNRLLQSGATVRVATKPLTLTTTQGPVSFGYGTIIVPTSLQQDVQSNLFLTLATIAREDGVPVYALTSGFAESGLDLGSEYLEPVAPISPLIVVGSGVDSYEVGEVWHLLDAYMGIPLSMVELSELGGVDLADYSHIIMVEGDYGDLDEAFVSSLGDWVAAGGVLVAQKGAATWAAESELVALSTTDPNEDEPPAEGEPAEEPEPVERRPYAQREGIEALELISGAIFASQVDTTHPIGYGLSPETATFRDTSVFFEPAANPYATVAQYTARPWLSGYISPENREVLAQKATVIAEREGEGSIILFADNPTFRGYFHGSNKFLLNALFFGRAFDY